jgi:hypothetical protein
MKNIKSIEQFLFESKATAKKRFLDRGLVSEEVFDRFLEVDITPTKKFIEKMCEFFVAGSTQEDIMQTFTKATQSKIKFDISLIKSLSELNDILSQEGLTGSRDRVKVKPNEKGVEITYEDDRFTVLYITSMSASKKYGSGTTWCISANEKNMFNEYYKKRNSRFYFIYDYKTTNKAWKKLAVEINDNNKDRIIVYNTFDNAKDYTGWEDDIIDVSYLIEKMGVPYTAFSKFNHRYFFQDYIQRANDGAEVTYEDDRFKVLHITNKEASIKYGNRNYWAVSKLDIYNQLEYNIKYHNLKYFFVLDKNNEDKKIAIKFNYTLFISLVGVGKLDKDLGFNYDFQSMLSYISEYFNYKFPENIFKDIDVNVVERSKFKSDCGIVGDYTINESGEIDVDGDVYISYYHTNLTELPIKYGKVTGHFKCYGNNLTTLKNCPDFVGGSFDCSENNLTSLKFAPSKVTRQFNCYNQKNGHQFSEEEVREVCEVGGVIVV